MQAALLAVALALAALAVAVALGSLMYLLCRLESTDDLRARLAILEGLREPEPEPEPKDTTPC